jgi:hypothetical protein
MRGSCQRSLAKSVRLWLIYVRRIERPRLLLPIPIRKDHDISRSVFADRTTIPPSMEYARTTEHAKRVPVPIIPEPDVMDYPHGYCLL